MPDLTQPQQYGTFPEGLLVTPADVASLTTNLDNAVGEIVSALGGPNFIPANNPLQIVPGNGMSLNIGGGGQSVIAQGRILDYCPQTNIAVAPAGNVDRVDFIAIKALRQNGPNSEMRVVRADSAPLVSQVFSGTLVGGSLTIELTATYETAPMVVGLVAMTSPNTSVGKLTAASTTTTVTVSSSDPNDTRTVNFLVYGAPTGANGSAQSLPLLVNTPTYQYGETNAGTPTPASDFDTLCTFIVRANAISIAAADITIVFPTLPALSDNLHIKGLIVDNVMSAGEIIASGNIGFANGAFFDQNSPNILNLCPGGNNNGGIRFSDAANDAYNTEFPDSGGIVLARGELVVGGSSFAANEAILAGTLNVGGGVVIEGGLSVGGVAVIDGALTVGGGITSPDVSANDLYANAFHLQSNGVASLSDDTSGSSGWNFASAANSRYGFRFFIGAPSSGDLIASIGPNGAAFSSAVEIGGPLSGAGASFGAEVTAPEFYSGGSYFTADASHFQGPMEITGALTADGNATIGGGLTVDGATSLSSLTVSGDFEASGKTLTAFTGAIDPTNGGSASLTLGAGEWIVEAFCIGFDLGTSAATNYATLSMTGGQQSPVAQTVLGTTYSRYLGLTCNADGGSTMTATVSFRGASIITNTTQISILIRATRV